ncbi:glycoside hydrolase family 78 protein [Echinicola jeungdonensis]|uniref:alpha-L-rhamnosidase n=1 Tax=Echinicola jeungdonensis TaxID=709343 RepID=A0ABV5J5M1_9BACT|nr:glycoside hydrolase family 78 protein [Echinicola jeungdonensis]MDN3669359.1 glycoside hydrolase family 78 protein [Echinicola jeungdonensis]
MLIQNNHIGYTILNNKVNFLALLLVLLAFCQCNTKNTSSDIQLGKLTTELAVNPIGIKKETPRFGWELESNGQGVSQKAYHIIVASSKGKAENGEGDIWDSGMVASDKSQLVPYGGETLERASRFFWRVKVWNQHENGSDWSEVNFFETAPDASFLDAHWIGAITREESHLPEGRDYHTPVMGKEKKEKWSKVDPLAKQSIQLRKTFEAGKDIEKATVYISGLGHYELTLNGEKVGNSEFAPLWSDYDKTVYYNSYEVKDLLQNGENAIGVLLGNGMYNVAGERYTKFKISFGPPTLFFKMKLKFTDGSEEVIASDDSWKWSNSPITFNCIFGGEDYNANLEQEGWNKPGFDDRTWQPVVIQNAPKGKLRPQNAPPVAVQKSYEIQEVNEPEEDLFVLDMGQNLSGFPSIKVKGKKGQKVKLVVGEHLKENGTVGQGRTGGPHYYEYTLKGEGEEFWQPRFSYYGYQYIQVDKVNLPGQEENPDWPTLVDIKSNFIYNDAGTRGNFASSNEIFNQTHELIDKAVKSNMHSVFTDCPHREKLGWLEETHLNGPGLFYNYNLATLVPKVMQDMADAQRENGLVPSIAPEYVIFGGDFTDSPEWGVACVVLPWMYYDYYGDPSLIHEYYGTMKKYVDYLSSTADNHIVSHGLGDWYDYGEHVAGYSKNSPIALSATSHYYFGIQLLTKAAKMLGNTADEQKYSRLGENVKAAFNKEFYNEEIQEYGTESQFSNAIPIFLDLVSPEDRDEVLNNLVEDVNEKGNRLSTGDVGNRYLYQVLARNGHNELMYKMHNHYETPGYGFQIKFGLTTLTEQWDPRKGNSWNHFMMGQIEEWFYRSLAGIVPDKENPGFKHFYLKPKVVGDMTGVEANHESLYGNIKSAWKLDGDSFNFEFSIPVNSEATVILPVEKDAEVTVNGVDLEQFEGAELVENENHPALLLGSGNYRIKSTYGPVTK